MIAVQTNTAQVLTLYAERDGFTPGWYIKHNPSGKIVRISNFYSEDEEEAMRSCFEGDNQEFMRLYFPELSR